MSAGFLVADQCVEEAGAPDAFFSQIKPSTTAGATTYLTTPKKTATGWMLDTYADGTLISTTSLTYQPGQSCDTADKATDSITLAWLVVAALAAAWSIKSLQRAIYA